MLNKFNNKSKAYAAVEHVLDKYPDIVNGVAKLLAATATFKTKLRNIEDYHVPDRSGTMPLTDFKTNLLMQAQLAVEVERSAVVWYARENKMTELEARMPRNQTELQLGTAEERIQRYQNVHKEAVKLKAALADFGCDQAAMDEVETLLPQLRANLSTTQHAIDDRMATRSGRTQLYKDMDDFLKSTLDLAVKTRQRLFPAFVAEYLEARVLPKSPVRSPKDATTTPKQQKGATPPPATEEPTRFRDEPEMPPAAEPMATVPQPSENGVLA